MVRRIAPLRDFLSNESSSGILLLIAATLGLFMANSPLTAKYFEFLNYSFEFTSIAVEMTVLKFINYALMTIFFFVVGLEIKRELTSGHLSRVRQAAAPFFAALGGMLVPAGIYLLIAGDIAPAGWAIPVATDIALAVGVLSLMGSRVTQGLKAFLLALAVIDDIGAILIIAIVYSAGVTISWLMAAAFSVLVILLLQKIQVSKIWVYVIIGVLLWYSFYRAGLHPTLAGVILGLLTPARQWVGELNFLERLEHRVHPLSSFFVVPIFAFANSGVALSNEAWRAAINSPIAWGIVIGLVVGKPLGVFVTALSVDRLRVAELPLGTTKRTLFATGSTAGIGFTVAIFIAKLAFESPDLQDLAVTAVIVGSVLSALISVTLFRFRRLFSSR